MHVRREARLVDDHRCGVELSLAPTPVKSSQKNRPDAPYEGLPPNRWMPGTNAKCPLSPGREHLRAASDQERGIRHRSTETRGVRVVVTEQTSCPSRAWDPGVALAMVHLGGDGRAGRIANGDGRPLAMPSVAVAAARPADAQRSPNSLPRSLMCRVPRSEETPSGRLTAARERELWESRPRCKVAGPSAPARLGSLSRAWRCHSAWSC